MEAKVTCRRMIEVSENEYKIIYHLRMLANRSRQHHREEMAIVRISPVGIKMCNVDWNNGDKGGNS